MESLDSSFLTQGPLSEKLERVINSKFKSKYSKVVSNGSTALLACLMYLKLKLNFYDCSEKIILISNNTFVASANASKLLGFNVIPIDIDKNTGSVSYKSLKDSISKLNVNKIIAFINTYYAGFVYDNVKIFNFLKKRKIYYIEDACHSIGSQYLHNKNKHFIGSCKHSDFCIFSFHAVKNITSGEGGAITYKKKKDDIFLKKIRNNGIEYIYPKNSLNEYDVGITSSNFRLSEIHCALAISQFSELEVRKKKRVELYNYYLKIIKKTKPSFQIYNDKISSLIFPHLMVIKISFKKLGISRKSLQKTLLDKYDIGSQVHYKPLSKLKILNNLNSSNFSSSETFYDECLSIPLHNHMVKKDIHYIVESINFELSKS